MPVFLRRTEQLQICCFHIYPLKQTEFSAPLLKADKSYQDFFLLFLISMTRTLQDSISVFTERSSFFFLNCKVSVVKMSKQFLGVWEENEHRLCFCRCQARGIREAKIMCVNV